MSSSDRFHDLLFEMSNETRFKILHSLRDETKRIADLTRDMNLTTTEARRHVIRLSDKGLIERNIEGFYNLTPYGITTLFLYRNLNFFLFIVNISKDMIHFEFLKIS